ncbi:MAG: hypothetical protein K2N15_05315 [Lachnospiraceae bacterium]|nr:hypothetical protein [Lachnospiraceae bacterium]
MKMDRLNDMAQMISSYTEQIERYESLSTWCALLTIICILAVLIFAGSLVVKNHDRIECSREGYNLILSGLFLTIPSITTLYLYTFAMNMRKVALFRGYLSFLENQWNVMADSEMMLFDSRIINKFFSPQAFLVNGLGPVVMTVFMVISVFLGLGLSFYFACRLQNSTVKRGMKLLICVWGIVCILFSGICCYYLTVNDSVVKEVFEECQTGLLLE